MATTERNRIQTTNVQNYIIFKEKQTKLMTVFKEYTIYDTSESDGTVWISLKAVDFFSYEIAYFAEVNVLMQTERI